MTELIEIKEKYGDLFVDSRVVARSLEIEHESILRLLKIEEIGVSRFEIGKPKSPKGGRPEKYALLSERQALILLTFVQNTESAKQAKIKLVDSFLEMRNILKNKKESKNIRNRFTSVLQNHGYTK